MMSAQGDRHQVFSQLHRRGHGFIIPNPWDAGSAKYLQHLGFEALATTSAGAAFSLGLVDGAATREQILDNARAIVAAVSVPVSADLTNGFGATPETVAQTISLAAAAGLSGGSIEDTSGDSEQPLFDFALSVARIEAAVETVKSLPHPFILTARCDGLLAGACDLAEAIRRIQHYQEAGADVVYIPGLGTLEQVHSVLAAIDKPLNVLGTIGQLTDAKALLDAGVHRVSVGGSLYTAAAKAFEHAAQALKNGSLDFIDGATSFTDIQTRLAE